MLTCGTYLLGVDLTQSYKYLEFQEAWENVSVYIAKGAGNFHTLLGQKLSLPGLDIRMMKGSLNAYKKVSEIKGIEISIKTYYDALFIFQNAHKLLNLSLESSDTVSSTFSSLASMDRDIFHFRLRNVPRLVSETSLMGVGACVGGRGGSSKILPLEILDNRYIKNFLRYKYARP